MCRQRGREHHQVSLLESGIQSGRYVQRLSKLLPSRTVVDCQPDSYLDGGVLTETINIIASLFRERSLHIFVKSGSPTGTNAKPGGGLVSFVT